MGEIIASRFVVGIVQANERFRSKYCCPLPTGSTSLFGDGGV